MSPVRIHQIVTDAPHLLHQSLDLGAELMHDIEFLKSVPLTLHPSGKMDCSAERGLDDGGKEPPLGKYIPATGACLPIAVFMENDHGKTLYG